MRRPIGWWLKEADTRLDAAFDDRLADSGVTRRGWQVLTWLTRGPSTRAGLVGQLSAFDPPAILDTVVAGFVGQGWIVDDGEQLTLTPAGRAGHAPLVEQVAEIRGQVAQVLPGDDYRTLLRLLSRLVDAFPPVPEP